ncbi:uncharacterized protein LOC130798830 [Amaranthus tricolor]|uniref:uncharacterized protein LOC130798830 n=1 Tax=Amaranthus tricolor TaxID=29722 RepID=UPI00258283C1|nr:uncharacterized protein LOC130798830 [Amaranthus tricolor]
METSNSNQRSKQAIRCRNKVQNCGRKRVVVTPNIIESKPMGEHTCIRDAATCLDLSPSTVWRLIKRGKIKAHSNPLHPALTDANKIRRVEWIWSLIQEDTIQRHPIYKAIYDFIHIDEKWFYLTKKTQRIYLAHKEKVPYRAGKSSKFISKAMFLSAVARPRWNQYGQCTFDGKIGIFPFINMVATQRDSKNRPRGSIEIKPTKSIQSIMHKKMPKNIRELITTVEDAFEELHPKILTNVWISLQHHLNEILKVKGCNNYIQPLFGNKKYKNTMEG